MQLQTAAATTWRLEKEAIPATAKRLWCCFTITRKALTAVMLSGQIG